MPSEAYSDTQRYCHMLLLHLAELHMIGYCHRHNHDLQGKYIRLKYSMQYQLACLKICEMSDLIIWHNIVSIPFLWYVYSVCGMNVVVHPLHEYVGDQHFGLLL